MRFWNKILFVLLFFLLIFRPINVLAQRGCCSYHRGVCGCDTSVGRQVCCDGTYSPSCTCAYIPAKPKTPTFPNMNASWGWTFNSDKTFNLTVTLDDSSPTQYSAVINKCKGCDPGPLTDFNSNIFTFNKLKTGRYYLNVKKAINGVWSTVAYWTIDIPEWTTPTSTPFPTMAPLYQANDKTPTDGSSFGDFVLILFLLAIIGICAYVGYKFLKWLIKYAKEHDWVFGLIFWIVIIILIIWLN